MLRIYLKADKDLLHVFVVLCKQTWLCRFWFVSGKSWQVWCPMRVGFGIQFEVYAL